MILESLGLWLSELAHLFDASQLVMKRKESWKTKPAIF